MSNAEVPQKAPYPVDVEGGKTYFWCACGRSARQPFCDGSHKGSDFTPVTYKAEQDGKVFFAAARQAATHRCAMVATSRFKARVTPATTRLCEGWLEHPQVLALLQQHLAEAYAASPAESVHALDTGALQRPGVRFVTLWELLEADHAAHPNGVNAADSPEVLLGCAALKRLSDTHAELKSMRTADEQQRRGVATLLLRAVIGAAKAQGIERISLETGSMHEYAPARALYTRHGFTTCAPFAGYCADINSHYMSLNLRCAG